MWFTPHSYNMCDILVTHKRFRRKREKVNNEIKTKAIVLAICIVVLVAMSALASAGEKPENLADGITNDLSSTENDTIIVHGWGTPKLEITAKTVEPNVIAPGGVGVLKLTISEVWGSDYAQDTTVYVEILDPDDCVFLETGSSQAEKDLGRIDEDGSKEASFNLSVPAYAPLGERTVNITVKYWDPEYWPLPDIRHYEYASINFNVNNPTVSISTGNYTALRNEDFTVNITVDQTVPIAGVQFDLSFDSSLVSVDSVTEGNLLTQDGASTYFSPGTIDNTAGTITGVVGAITTPGQTVSAPSAFATIQMSSKNDAGTSPLSLSKVTIAGIDAFPEPTMVNDGSVTVLPYDDCDVNKDLHCNVLDIIRVVQRFGETGSPHWIREDVNRDGNVNVLDIIVIGQHWTG
jgi:hypothetical protein